MKNHNLPQNAIDASDKDDVINIAAWPVMGLYLPDAIDSYNVNGIDYIVSANEGDSRDYDGYSEEERVKDVNLDPTLFPDAASFQENGNIGRLKMTTSMGNFDGDNDFDTIYTFGARSFSIWNGSTGDLVFDSGDDIEQITAAAYQNDFNSTNDENESFDSRSDDKGPEPERIVVGEIDGDYYAFIGLERMGGVMVYKISDPSSPEFIQYITTRDFSGDPAAGSAGNMGPEGLIFIPANESPNGKNLLVVTYEISGSVQVFEINEGTVPVELNSFVASLEGNSVNLVWRTSSESNNKGFEVERSIDNQTYAKIAEISGNGTTSEMNFYSFTDKNVNSGKYYYRLKQIDFNGDFTYSETIEISINQPESFSLSQNFPNPFNPSTTITFSVPEKSNVSLQVYDLLGKEIATLMNEVKAAGNYTINFDASRLSSGVYYYRLVAGNFISVRKMNLIK